MQWIKIFLTIRWRHFQSTGLYFNKCCQRESHLNSKILHPPFLSFPFLNKIQFALEIFKMSFPCLSSAAIQCNEYSWRASHQRHAVWKRVFLEFLSLKGSRWCVRQGLFLYHDPVPPNSNSSKILFQTWTSLRPHFNSLILVIICAEAPAKLCYAPCVYLEAFLFGLRQNYFAAWLFQELSSTMGQWLLHLLSLHCWPVFKNAFWKLCWIFLCLKILILGQDCMFRSHHK